ncbi:hypothetical protein ONZ51_g9570 [Trametes cubensis]|uniref:Uncharacterized protein n=1 Tax=Trametes cubensis TaxID=1111947 RepID=A0AAD7TLI9_9APHY|nr:hypothetical protein ONZ51_g9570 [Trametes cubensis]
MKNLTKKQLETLVSDLQKEVESLTLGTARTQVETELEAVRQTELEAVRQTANEHVQALVSAQAQIAAAEQATIVARTQVAIAEEAAEVAQAQAAAAEAARAVLQQQLNAAATAPAAAGTGDGLEDLPEIARPAGSGWSIRESMDMNRADYAEVQRTIRGLVIRAQLDWTEDFRRQDADKLATLFRAARKAHPVLRRYINNWATAAIAKQYMQNKRKHAYMLN